MPTIRCIHRVGKVLVGSCLIFMIDNSLKTNLDESNFFGVAAEALPAAHEPILSDQPMRVSTNPADPNKTKHN